jgi:hypothetical protein
MAERNLARVAAGALSVLGAGAGMLWAAYVFYGLFTHSGVVEPLVEQFYGRPSLRLDALVAGVIGGLVYWLADLPRRRLKAGQALQEQPGRAPLAPRFPGQPVRVSPAARAEPARAEVPRRRPGLVVAVLLALALLGGLSWYYMTPAGQKAVATVRPSSSPSEGSEDQGGAVLNAVVQAQNDFGWSAQQSATSYAREFGTGPQVRRGDSPVVSSLGHSALQSIERLAARLEESPGDDALHKLAGAYVTAARALAGPLEEAERYYGRGAQKEDGWARGKALHAQLRAAFHEFFTAAEGLSVEARRLGKERRVRIRAKLTAAGSVRRVSAMDAVDQGRALVDLIERRNARRDVEPGAMAAALASFQTTVDQLRGLAKDEAGTQREFGPTYAAASFGTLAHQAEYVLRTAKEVERDTRTGPGSIPEPSEEPGERLTRTFNDMVREANHLYQ